MKHATILLLLFFILLPAAQAQEETAAQSTVQKELDTVRTLLDEALSEYRAGRVDEAYTTARSAYLDHFENVEPFTRPLNPDLTLELEIKFAQLREMIKNRAPTEKLEAKVSEINTDLERVEALFSKSTTLIPTIAFILSFSIIFREGLEAVLISAIILAYLDKTRNYQLKKYIYYGIIIAIAASLATWPLFTYLINISGADKESIEVITSFAAVLVLFYVSFYLIRRVDERRWMEFLKAKSWHAMQSGKYLSLVLMAFLAVYREGFETVLFYKALYTMSHTLSDWLTTGFIAGTGALIISGLAIFAFGKHLPLKHLLALTVLIAASLSIFFTGNAVRELQILGYIPITPLTDTLPRINPVLADLLGYRRTLETLAAQAALGIAYLAGGVYTMFKIRRGEIHV